MIKNYIFLLKLTLISAIGYAQSYQPITIDGFNGDVIANGVGSSSVTTTTDVDGVNYCFCEVGWQSSSSASGTSGGLPVGGLITSTANASLTFQLQDYDDDNSIRLTSATNEVTSNITDDGDTYTKVYVLTTSGSGQSNMNVEITFTDATSQSFTSNVPDWFNSTLLPVASSGFGRVNMNNDSYESPFNNPRLYQMELNLDAINHTKTIESITFTRNASSGGIINIFAVSGLTLGECPGPNDVSVSNVGTTTADIEIVEPALLPTEYVYEVRTAGTPGSTDAGLVTSGTLDAGETTINLTDLPTSTDLYFYIQSVCDDEETSAWSAATFFHTVDVTPSPWIEAFSSSLPLGWTSSFTNTNNGTLQNAEITGYYLYRNLYSWTPSAELTTINVGPILANDELTFDYRLKNYSGTNAPGAGSGNFVVSISTDFGETYTDVETVDNNSLTTTQTFTYDLSDYEDEYVKIKIVATWSSGDYYIGFDNFKIANEDSCFAPNNVTLEDISLFGATVAWQDTYAENAESFEYELRTSGAAGSGTDGLVETMTVDSGETLEAIFEELEGLTTYYFYVRSTCSDTENSPWTPAFDFTTEYCTPSYSNTSFSHRITTVEIEETSFVDNIPSVYDTDRTNIEVPEMTVGETYTFNATTTGWTGVGAAIDYNMDGDFDDENELIGLPDYIANSTQTYTFTHTIPTNVYSGEYRMRVWSRLANAGGDPNDDPCGSYGYGTYLDYKIVIIGNDLVCTNPTNIEVQNIESYSADITWDADEDESFTYEIEYGVDGFTQGEGEIVTSDTNSVTLEDLAANTTYDVYIKKVCSSDEQSNWVETSFTTLCDIVAPPAIEPIHSCEIMNVADVAVSLQDGETARWYATAESNAMISTISQSGTYYVSAYEDGCESDRIAVEFTIILLPTPEPTPIQEFCGAAFVSELETNSQTDHQVNWYDNANATEALPSTALINTGTYYMSYSGDGCETEKEAVIVYVYEIPDSVEEQTFAVCGYASLADFEIDIPEGGVLNWYASMENLTPLEGTTQAQNGTFYASVTYNNCESERTPIHFVVYAGLPMPAASSQTFCESATVADLVASGLVSGAEFYWYDAADATQALATDTALQNGTYYVSQENAECESTRRAISVRVIQLSAPVINPIFVCDGEKISDVDIPATTGVEYVWYSNPTTTTPIDSETVLSTNVYFISKTLDGCESERTTVDVVVNPVPDAPTGETQQSFTYDVPSDVTIADLLVNEDNVTWYMSEEDAIDQYNPLAADMPLTDGNTYYAIIVNEYGCMSDLLAVTVSVTLSNEKFDQSQLVYYPNPTQGNVNIQYNAVINQVDVYNTLGQRVNTQNFDNNQVTVDMSQLSAGTYLLKLYSGQQQQLIKIIKK